MLAIPRRILLFLVGFTLPIQGLAIKSLGLHATPFKIATAALLALGGFHMASGRRAHDTKVFWVALFAVSYFISSVQGFLEGTPASVLVREGVSRYALLLYYVLIGYVIFSRSDLKILLWGFVAGAVATALPAALGLEAASRLGRYKGLAGQTNILGFDMSMVAPVILGLFLSSRSRFAKLTLAGAAVITLGGLLMSLSRTAYVAGLTMWGFWMYRSGRVDSIKYALPAIPVLIGVMFLMPSSVSDRFNTMVDPAERAKDNSIQGRLRNFEWGFRAFASNPLLGVGQYNYIPWAHAQRGGEVVDSKIHTGPLRILANQGLLGFIPYAMVLFLTWTQYERIRRLTRSRRHVRDPVLQEAAVFALALETAFVGMLAAGLTNHIQVSKTAWLVLALSPVLRNMVARRIEELQASAPAEETQPAPFRSLPGHAGAWSG
jgi:O-antigen ligase